MENAWYVVLRDVLIILATASLTLMSLTMALVAWQLYRLGRELRDEAQPILDSVHDTAETVRGTTSFVGGRVVSPAAAALGVVAGAREVYGLLRTFYQGEQGTLDDDGGE